MIEVWHYINRNGNDVVDDWLDGLRDPVAKGRIEARLNRLKLGNFGDWRSLEKGVCELKIDYGPGYRVYYAMIGPICVLLLCGGDKRKQAADIERAIENLNDFKRRRGET
jgi:putative addiction module killer protein